MPIQRKNLQVTDLVMVEWIDAQGTEAWADIDHLSKDEPPLIRTVGFITSINKKYISISQSIDLKNHSACHTMLIPAGMIQSVSKI